LLKDINLKTKHVKGKAEGEIGQIVQVGLQESFNTTLLHLTAEL
jgi:large subunit ribosomal protein L24